MSDDKNNVKTINQLTRALSVQQQVAKTGFDWPSWHGALEKVREEVEEVFEELNAPSQDSRKINEELGDLLFAIVNVVRHQNTCPNELLQHATDKFETRYLDVQHYICEQGLTMEDATDEQMEAGWQYAKACMKNRR